MPGVLLRGRLLGEPALRGAERQRVAERATPGRRRRRRSSGSSVARVSASAAIIVPNTCASTGAAGSADAVTSRLAASSSGPSGDHACQAAISSGAAAAGQTRWKPVSSGAATVAKASAVTTPKRAPPAPRSAQNRSGSRVRVAGHGAAVGQRHLRGAQGVRGQPVAAAEDPQPAAEGQAGDADVRPAAGRDRDPVRRERVVDVAQPRAGPDHGGALGVLDRVQRGDVEHEPVARRRPAGEAVAAAARRHGQPRGRGEASAVATSRSLAQRTTACGRTSAKLAIAGRRAAS